MPFYKKTPDIIIRNGCIVDGTGKPAYYADLAIVGDKIDYIGSLRDVHAPVEIDATGKYVTPGFIDAHTHSDYTIWGNPECQSSVRQGVTTEIVGNCGLTGRTRMTGVPFDPAGDGIDCIYNLEGPTYPQGNPYILRYVFGHDPLPFFLAASRSFACSDGAGSCFQAGKRSLPLDHSLYGHLPLYRRYWHYANACQTRRTDSFFADLVCVVRTHQSCRTASCA